jgi:hypothetical protein
MTEILLKVTLNTINLTNLQYSTEKVLYKLRGLMVINSLLDIIFNNKRYSACRNMPPHLWVKDEAPLQLAIIQGVAW